MQNKQQKENFFETTSFENFNISESSIINLISKLPLYYGNQYQSGYDPQEDLAKIGYKLN
jgi:hypothetical protein